MVVIGCDSRGGSLFFDDREVLAGAPEVVASWSWCHLGSGLAFCLHIAAVDHLDSSSVHLPTRALNPHTLWKNLNSFKRVQSSLLQEPSQLPYIKSSITGSWAIYFKIRLADSDLSCVPKPGVWHLIWSTQLFWSFGKDRYLDGSKRQVPLINSTSSWSSMLQVSSKMVRILDCTSFHWNKQTALLGARFPSYASAFKMSLSLLVYTRFYHTDTLSAHLIVHHRRWRYRFDSPFVRF